MNLYSIYDAESGQFLGANKTSAQIEYLFGIDRRWVQSAARKGSLVGGKYRIEVTEKKAVSKHGYKQFDILDEWALRWMREWDNTTEKIRRQFDLIRKCEKRKGEEK